MPPIDGLTRATLEGLRRRRIRDGRNFTKACIDVVEVAGRDVVVKDVAGRSWIVSRILGPRQLDRETRAYLRLQGVEGIPAFLGRPDRQAIVLEFVPGRTLAEVRPGELDPSFFDHLERLVGALHARGVAHGDLHRHDVLVGPSGLPHVVDFSTSVTVPPVCGPARRWVFSQMRQADARAVAKLRSRLSGVPRRDLPARPASYALGAVLKRALSALRRKARRR